MKDDFPGDHLLACYTEENKVEIKKFTVVLFTHSLIKVTLCIVINRFRVSTYTRPQNILKP